jgi:hypothetical protein
MGTGGGLGSNETTWGCGCVGTVAGRSSVATRWDPGAQRDTSAGPRIWGEGRRRGDRCCKAALTLRAIGSC